MAKITGADRAAMLGNTGAAAADEQDLQAVPPGAEGGGEAEVMDGSNLTDEELQPDLQEATELYTAEFNELLELSEAALPVIEAGDEAAIDEHMLAALDGASDELVAAVDACGEIDQEQAEAMADTVINAVMTDVGPEGREPVAMFIFHAARVLHSEDAGEDTDEAELDDDAEEGEGDGLEVEGDEDALED